MPEVGRVEIEAGKIIVFAGSADAKEFEAEVSDNEWDSVK
jgi:hypothetical protein